MDNPDQRSAVKHLIDVLRRITRLVQLAPFVYLLLLAVYLLTEPLLPDDILGIADHIADVPIIGTLTMLVAGRILNLCAWFKAACLLPMATKVQDYIDAFLYCFTQNEIVVVNVFLALFIMGFLAISFKHFFYGRQATSH